MAFHPSRTALERTLARRILRPLGGREREQWKGRKFRRGFYAYNTECAVIARALASGCPKTPHPHPLLPEMVPIYTDARAAILRVLYIHTLHT